MPSLEAKSGSDPYSKSLPDSAQVVIVGGGIAGASTAYHLARLGCTDVVLLEQGKLTCGTTWHAAGLVGQLRATRNATRMSRYGIELYATLEAETGVPVYDTVSTVADPSAPTVAAMLTVMPSLSRTAPPVMAVLMETSRPATAPSA